MLSVERKSFSRLHFILSFPCSRKRKSQNGNEKQKSGAVMGWIYSPSVFLVRYPTEGQPIPLFIFVFIRFSYLNTWNRRRTRKSVNICRFPDFFSYLFFVIFPKTKNANLKTDNDCEFHCSFSRFQCSWKRISHRNIILETKWLQEKPIFDFAFFMWDEGKNLKTITLKGKRFPFSFPFTGILKLENGKPKRFSVRPIRFLFFMFRLHHVSCSGQKEETKNGKNLFSFRFLYPFPQEGRRFLYFVLRLPLQIGMKRKMKKTELVFRIPHWFRKTGNCKSQIDHDFRFLMFFIPFYRKWKTHIGLLLRKPVEFYWKQKKKLSFSGFLL